MTVNQTPITQTTSFTCESCGINVEDRVEHISLSEAIERLGGWNKPGSALCEGCWPGVKPGADIPDEVVDVAVNEWRWTTGSDHEAMRAALAAADAQRAEPEGSTDIRVVNVVAELTDKPKPGLYEKYRVARTDGRPVGECFVLEMTDPTTALALKAYADATSNEKLAADLRQRLGEPGPQSLTDEQVEVLRDLHLHLDMSNETRLIRHANSLRAAFPKVFTPKPKQHPWDEDLQPGNVAVWRQAGRRRSDTLVDQRHIDNWRKHWTENADRITDWQVFRPNWTKDGEQAGTAGREGRHGRHG